MPSSKTDDRRSGSATTIRLSDYETKGARVSWRDAQIQRPEIRLPRLTLDPAPPRGRVEP
jgi:hypothetical protein